MNFGYTPEQEALRREVNAFIAEHVTPEVLHDKEAQDDQMHGSGVADPFGPSMRELYGKLHARGWLGIAYPKEYGGQGGDRISQYIVEEAFMRVGLNISLSGSGAPAIMAAGTEEQKRYYIPRLITREVTFALGFTEPHAGADLANIRCRATRDGDHFVINGQKIYTTSGHLSSHIYLMARTDPSLPKREGLSIFIFPMDTPGITVRPLWSIQNNPRAPLGTTYGEARTNETFFDNVRVHESTLLGGENKGWKVAADGLNLDRVGAFRYVMSIRRDEDMVNWVKTTELEGYADNPAVRDKVAELWIEAQVCRLMTMRSMSIVQRGREFTYEGSAEKVWAPEHGVRTTEAITQMLGPYGQLLRGSPHAVEDGVFAHNVLGAFQSGVNHGGVTIMRDQVARRGLGLPAMRRPKAAAN
ncbi:acyl-CoA dehydrogenase family protein [Roseomonas populi]|uniref:Acyl-CoA dehydrogenase family protein n=1 Tax=Roseomonas populi TaxID=3121582 RepID=A0ABT1X3Q1_9PROT|nr:acyl-CoA dehydrogenase family protein [Roseomonas pecuniae]MCR0982731.1 acyl-CoA dehydrogenase family protein [Roseomonas pecuniae]